VACQHVAHNTLYPARFARRIFWGEKLPGPGARQHVCNLPGPGGPAAGHRLPAPGSRVPAPAIIRRLHGSGCRIPGAGIILLGPRTPVERVEQSSLSRGTRVEPGARNPEKRFNCSILFTCQRCRLPVASNRMQFLPTIEVTGAVSLALSKGALTLQPGQWIRIHKDSPPSRFVRVKPNGVIYAVHPHGKEGVSNERFQEALTCWPVK